MQARAKSHTYPVSLPFLLHFINYYGKRIIWVILPSQWSGEDDAVLYRFDISENQLQLALLLTGFLIEHLSQTGSAYLEVPKASGRGFWRGPQRSGGPVSTQH